AAVGFMRLARLGAQVNGALPFSASYQPLTVDELAAADGAIQIVDVREPDEQDVLAPGALAVPSRLLREADLSAPHPDPPGATSCQSGVGSAAAASLLEQRGFRDVRPVLGGGMGRWPLPASA